MLVPTRNGTSWLMVLWPTKTPTTASPRLSVGSWQSAIQHMFNTLKDLNQFRSLQPIEDSRDTIEFQLFPSTTNPAIFQQYVLFALALLSSAIRVSTTYYTNRIAELQNATLDDLRQFIAPHPHEAFRYCTLFSGKTHDADAKRNEQRLLPAEWAQEAEEARRRAANSTPLPIVEIPCDRALVFMYSLSVRIDVAKLAVYSHRRFRNHHAFTVSFTRTFAKGFLSLLCHRLFPSTFSQGFPPVRRAFAGTHSSFLRINISAPGLRLSSGFSRVSKTSF
ncbi:uncharacterized protein BJ212DRAFT_1392812 [Suillus subaureus]|uniref:Uncharacterized protein n=1 Tax=Suillus subaureus TaxID=48587 RepID=A0A9P7J6I1_9AGAM|nr:uncharacterized protein BJ212DRAFT_1392812 [Suillus subaureus]KAG1805215.1 hypothetical protein BJ212DRAFT_1392812 [Suillus subaureus]